MPDQEKVQGQAPPAPDICPVCAEPRKAGSRRCGTCESLYSWTGVCLCCGIPVPEEASICHGCGNPPRSSGRWGRLVTSGQGALSLLIAFFSVAGTLVALLSQTTFFHRSSTSVSFAEVPPDTSSPADRELWLKVNAYNSGNRPAFLSGARLVSPFRGAELKTQLELKETRIKPDDPQRLELRLNRGWDIQQFGVNSLDDARYKDLLAAPHRVEIGIQEFGEPLTWREVEVPLPDVQKWLSDVTTEPILESEDK